MDHTPAERNVLASLDLMAEAKSTLVHMDGIGSELHPTLLAWEGTTPIGYAMLHDWPPSPAAFMRLLAIAAGLMVNGWHATGLAICLESYAENADPFIPPNEPHHSLASRYATDPSIQEALWVAYADRLGDMSMGVTTYTQTVPRTVIYDDPVLSSIEQHQDFDTEGTLPHLLRATLATHPSRPAPKGATIAACRHAISAHIHQLGFAVFLPGEPEWQSQLHPNP